jgi:predicted CopG family antitoxin
MHRSQIMLKEEHYAYLVSEAQRQDKSISQIVRELIDEHMGRSRNLEGDPFFDIIGMVEGDDPDAAIDHDHYVYGLPRRSEERDE